MLHIHIEPMFLKNSRCFVNGIEHSCNADFDFDATGKTLGDLMIYIDDHYYALDGAPHVIGKTMTSLFAPLLSLAVGDRLTIMYTMYYGNPRTFSMMALFARNGVDIFKIMTQECLFNLLPFGRAHGKESDDAEKVACPCGCDSDDSLNNNLGHIVVVKYGDGNSRAYNKHLYLKSVQANRMEPLTRVPCDDDFISKMNSNCGPTFVACP